MKLYLNCTMKSTGQLSLVLVDEFRKNVEPVPVSVNFFFLDRSLEQETE